MPSPRDTFYNIKRLHLLFALSSLALLAVTVWMVIADHRREWKVYQRVFYDRIEPWLTEAQIRARKDLQFAQREEELVQSLEDARRTVPDRHLVERFLAELDRAGSEAGGKAIEAAYQALLARPGPESRGRFFSRLAGAIEASEAARARADRLVRFRRAEFDEARNRYESAAGQGVPPDRLSRLRQDVDRLREELSRLTDRSEEARLHVDTLVSIRRQMAQAEDAARQALAEHHRQVDQLQRLLDRQRPNWGKRLLRLPLIEALGRPLAVRQIWLPELTIDYHFRPVPRFDRCTTCHLGIDKVRPGSRAQPACPPQKTIALPLAAPAAGPARTTGDRAGLPPAGIEPVYGFSLAPHGILDPNAPTVGRVVPESPAARAGLMPGDMILSIDGTPVPDRHAVEHLLNEHEGEDRPVALTVRRGLPLPYTSHPRLDLFVGSESPHPQAEFGCTICHDGQGSATSFRFASHTPNNPSQGRRWQARYGWFRNRHWPYPMLPRRFAESRCLKCHHQVTDLEPSRRFADPPAPKLVAGYQLVRQFGCFGCHEINGVTETGQSVGPDMRLEPGYAEAALQLVADPTLSDPQKTLARAVARAPENGRLRRRLTESIRSAAIPADRLRPDSRRALDVLREDRGPAGTMRKVGPSLRDAAGRLDPQWIQAWLRNPASLRPTTRMPAFYGMDEHLEGPSRRRAARWEAVEIQAVAAYLVAASQPVPPRPAPPEVTEPPSAKRGKRRFQLAGCLACHRHTDFPQAQSDVGPDLSDLSSKFTAPAARQWLVSWLRDPVGHAPRTRMPNPLLAPIPLEEEPPGPDTGAPGGEAAEQAGRPETRGPKMTDPAADIAAYLLAAPPRPLPNPAPLLDRDLDELALMHLAQTFPKSLARQYLRQGIPESKADQITEDAMELVGPVTRAKKLRYVGRRTIRRRGCFGCHDIPGFEDAQPIGPPLSSWGRKRQSLLAFEQVHRFVEESDPDPPRSPSRREPDHAFYRDALLAHRREGFLWQKLRAPRSFDYKKAENKPYDQWLTMGRFSLTDSQREAIITFILGLVADPPAPRYVYHPDRRPKAIIQGRKVLDKYGCAQCHVLEMEHWRLAYDPERFEPPPALPDFDFVQPHFSEEELAASAQIDWRGLGHAEVVGMPRLDQNGDPVEDVDDQDNPLYFFTLWEPVAINRQACAVGGAELMVSQPQIASKRPAWGGQLARMLYPVVLQEAWQAGSTATDLEAWGWLPPPLVREGRTVQPAWLYQYLLDPYPIRPAAVLRMPKYNLSPAEGARLVDYFAAASGAEFPYTTSALPAPGSGPAESQARRDQAMRILTDRTTYCAKCHLIGDYTPGDQVRTSLAPRLDRLSRRLRPEALRQWLASPKSVLPYTGMPANFPPAGPPLGQDLLPGSSLEQLDAVTDLLLHYDAYLKGRTSIRHWIDSTQKP